MQPTPSAGPPRRFEDRRGAGAILAGDLARFAHRNDVVVLALPRGGVPVGYEVARALGAPLDVFVVRKLGFPSYPELAFGALASGGVRVLNTEVLELHPLPQAAIDAVAADEQRELTRRERAYRGDRPLVPVGGRIAILVDDGLATGASMRAAALAVRQLHPARIVVAAPVGAWQACASLRDVADDVICAVTPEPFVAVGRWYADFTQTTDDEVRELLSRAGPDAAPRIARSA